MLTHTHTHTHTHTYAQTQMHTQHTRRCSHTVFSMKILLHLHRWICTNLDLLTHTHKQTNKHTKTHTHTHTHTQFFHENPYAFESLDLHEFLTQQDQTLEMKACRDLLQVYMAFFKEPLLSRALSQKKVYCRYVYRAVFTKETLFDYALLQKRSFLEFGFCKNRSFFIGLFSIRRSVVGIFTAILNRRAPFV